MVRVRASAVLAVALLLSACGRAAVVDAVPAAPRYDGPLFVKVTAAPTEEKADRSGAAGRVVDCDTRVRGDSSPAVYDGGPVKPSPKAALTEAVHQFDRGATTGFVEARTEQDRVLYTYEVDRRVRLAYVVHRGPAADGNTGWYVESWAACDLAEFPPAVAEKMGLQVWSDSSGRRIDTARIVSSRGPEHCNWEHMTFLGLDGGSLDGGRSYVAHPDPDYYPDYFRVPYQAKAALPADAQDSGYERDGQHLWLAPDHSRAYVGDEQSVAVWPAEVQPLGCA